MEAILLVVHSIVCIMLALIVLMQSGRGGGLTEGFASAENIFGAKTNSFMIKATTVFSCLFLITCLGLAVISAKKNRSLMAKAPVTTNKNLVDELFPEGINGIIPEAADTPAVTNNDTNVEEAPNILADTNGVVSGANTTSQ